MIYLDNAATTFPKPAIVCGSILNAIQNFGANPGRSGHKLSVEAARLVYMAREAVCGIFGGKDPFDFFFTLNCTDSLNMAIKGLLKPGDHVVTTIFEHNSVLRPLEDLTTQGIIYDVAKPENGKLGPEQIFQLIRPETRLVIVNHVSNVTGYVNDIDAVGTLCRKKGIIFMVDAAQSAGTHDINLSDQPIDILCTSGHKGLYGPQGSGILYLKPGLEIQPLRTGGTGSQSESLEQPDMRPDRYESGTCSTPAIAALGTAIEYIRPKIKEIREREIYLAQCMNEGLRNISGVTVYCEENIKSNVLSFNIKDMSSASVANILDRDYSIAVRSGLHCAPLIHRYMGTLETGAVRASLGMFNNIREIYTFLRAIEEIAHG